LSLAGSKKKEDSVKIEARKIAQRLGLEMKVTDVEYQGDLQSHFLLYSR
jgi:hypothetical protein